MALMLPENEDDRAALSEALKAQDLELWQIARMKSVEVAGSLLPYRVEPGAQFAVVPPYWERLKQEFYLLVCTEDERYTAIRKQASLCRHIAEPAIIGGVVAALAHRLGFQAALVAPFVKLLILAAATMAHGAFCSGQGAIALNNQLPPLSEQK